MFIFNPPVIAHRGLSVAAPENTLAAFRQAKTAGINWIEFDVMLAACGEVVVIHDATLERTTNGKGFVHDFSYEELKKLDAGSWFNSHFSHERIPTLEQVLELANELTLSINIEIKPFVGQEEETVKRVLHLLKNKNIKNPFFVSSFSLDVLRYVREYSKEILMGYLMDGWNAGWKMVCDELDCISVDIDHEILTREKAEEIKKNNFILLAYTVNDAARAKELFSWGVDAVFSDNPKKIIQK